MPTVQVPLRWYGIQTPTCQEAHEQSLVLDQSEIQVWNSTMDPKVRIDISSFANQEEPPKSLFRYLNQALFRVFLGDDLDAEGTAVENQEIRTPIKLKQAQ
jgi:hypothetical protein